MTIEFSCQGCQYLFKVPDTMAGKKGKCPKCGAITPIPTASGSPISAAPPPPPPLVGPDDRNLDDRGPDDYDDQPRRRRKKGGKGLIIGLSVGGAVLLLGIGGFLWWWLSSSGLSSDDAKFMPAGSKVIASAKVDEFLSSSAWKDIKKEFPKLAEMETDVGKKFPISLNDIDRVVVGADPEKEEFMVVMRFKKAVKASDIESKIPGEPKFKDTKVGKYTMREAEESGPVPLAYCQVDSKLIVAGTPSALKSALEKDKKPQFSSVMENALKDTDFGKTFAMAMDLKGLSKAKGGIPGLNNIPGMGMMGGMGGGPPGVDGMGISIKVSSSISGEAVMVCQDASTASKMRDEAKKSLSEQKKDMSKMQPEQKEVINSVSIGGSGTNVKFSASVKTATFISAIKPFAGMMR